MSIAVREQSEINEIAIESILPLKLRITVEGHEDRGGELCTRIVAKCHYYSFSDAQGSSIDLYRIQFGRLIRFATFNAVLSVEELTNG